MKSLLRTLGEAVMMILVGLLFALPASAAVGWGEVVYEPDGLECVDVEFVFARGSGAKREDSAEWREFEQTMGIVAARRGVSWRVRDLDYPAIEMTNLSYIAGAYVSAGRAYEFGRSVEVGRQNLLAYYRETASRCPETYWVLGGYSQGAMVVSKAVKKMKASKVLYVGLLGDPELSLPEGEGWLPKACLGGARSRYRVYAPDCRTNRGVFGGRNPYEYGELYGKYGLWCNAHDYICGSSRGILDNSGHTKYVAYHGVAWMASKVEGQMLKMKTQRRAVEFGSLEVEQGDIERVPNLSEYGLEAQLILPQTEYHGSSSERIRFDASASWHRLGDEPVYYFWNLDKKLGWSSGTRPWVEPEPLTPGHHTIYVTMRARGKLLAEATAQIVIDDGGEEERMSAPRVDLVRREGGVWLSWKDRSSYALWLRLNGVDLGYAKSERGEVGVLELDFSQENKLLLAWVDERFQLGEELVVDLNSLEEAGVDEGDGGNDDRNESGGGAGSEGDVRGEGDTRNGLGGIVALRLGSDSGGLGGEMGDFGAGVSSSIAGGAASSTIRGGASWVSNIDRSKAGETGNLRGVLRNETGATDGKSRPWGLLVMALAALSPLLWLFWRRRRRENRREEWLSGAVRGFRGSWRRQKYPPRGRRIDLAGAMGGGV